MAYNPEPQAVEPNLIQPREHHILKRHKVYFELNISAFIYLTPAAVNLMAESIY
jgi:hypothetical protein